MGLETPVGAGIETGGGERALDTKLVLLSLDVIGHGLQGIEVVDVIDALDLGAVSGNVLGQQILVVDQAVRLDNVVSMAYGTPTTLSPSLRATSLLISCLYGSVSDMSSV